MEYFIMNDGKKIPAIGLGTNTIARPGGDEAALETGLNMGYRLLDSAIVYNNEAGIGQVLERSNVPREELFIVTKIGCKTGMTDTREMIIDRVEQSLSNLKVDTIDLYLIHFPGDDHANILLTWNTLAELMLQGKIRSIGVSNFIVEHLELLHDQSTAKPVVNQVQYNSDNWNDEVVDYCHKMDILPMAYSPVSRMKDAYIASLSNGDLQYTQSAQSEPSVRESEHFRFYNR
jgi:diketogulonate reductase-like aldo/keto reductase